MKPMLAETINAMSDVRFPVIASAKLDGVRGVVIDGVLTSRSLKPIPNPFISAMFSRPELNGFDGEIIVGAPNAEDVCRVTVGTCSRKNATAAPSEVKFYVFDNYLARGGFEDRLKTIRVPVSAAWGNVFVLEQRHINNEAELLAFEAEMLEAGFEGLILRAPDAPYKSGRSTLREGGMLKLKRFSDSEAEIIEVVEEMKNTNEKVTNELGRGQRSTCKAGLVGKGRAGALLVRDLTSGVQFSIGAGFDAKERDGFWQARRAAVGKIVKYKSFAIGVKDAPRFPIFLGMRERWDMS